MFYVGMIRIGKSAKAPLEICKGSIAERLAFAKKLNSDFFDRLCPEFTSKDITSDIYEKCLKETTPCEINFYVADSSNCEFGGRVAPIHSKENPQKINSYEIALPLNKYDKKISMNDSDTSFHESFHYFFEILNPKHVARQIKIYESSVKEQSELFYKNHLYNKFSFNAKELKEKILPEFLKTLSFEDKINFLQNSRYRLTEEMHAWNEGSKYYEKIQDAHLDLISEKLDGSNGEEYNFADKIEILNEALKNALKARN